MARLVGRRCERWWFSGCALFPETAKRCRSPAKSDVEIVRQIRVILKYRWIDLM